MFSPTLLLQPNIPIFLRAAKIEEMMRDVRDSGIHPVDKHVGRRLKDLRATQGSSQGVLASALGVTFQQIQKYESGANRISASKLWEAAAFLGVEVGYFYIGLEEPWQSQIMNEPVPSTSSREILRLVARLSPNRQKLAMTWMKEMVAHH